MYFLQVRGSRYKDSVHKIVEENPRFQQKILLNPSAPVAASKGMRAVKLCTNKILQFVTGGAI